MTTDNLEGLDEVTEPSDAQVIFAAIDRKLRGVHTSAPGSIVAYDPTTQTATIQLTVQVETTDGDYETVPPLLEVPVVQPLTATHYLHLPPAPSDAVVVVFFEADPSQWFANALTSAPPLRRRHGFYPVAFLGGPTTAQRLTAAEAPATAAVFGSRAPGAVVGTLATHVALGDLAATNPVALATALDAWTASVVSWLAAHTHTSAAAGSPTSPPVNNPPPSAPTTAATKVKGI